MTVKCPLKIGRQNPDLSEVLEGSEPAEEVITSSYDTLGERDRIILKP